MRGRRLLAAGDGRPVPTRVWLWFRTLPGAVAQTELAPQRRWLGGQEQPLPAAQMK
jgi:hypothetical protein